VVIIPPTHGPKGEAGDQIALYDKSGLVYTKSKAKSIENGPLSQDILSLLDRLKDIE
jgi:hypothetical protein